MRRTFAGGVGQEDGQEIEHTVTGGVEDGVGGGVLAQQAQRGEQRQKALEQTDAGEGTHEGQENAGDGVHDGGADAALFVGRFGVGSHLAQRGHVGVFQHGIVHIRHIVADDHLILAVGLHDLENAVQCSQGLLVGFALVFQLKAEPGHAVGQGNNVFFAANIGNDVQRQLVVILCHRVFLLFFICVPRRGPKRRRNLTTKGYHFSPTYDRIKLRRTEVIKILVSKFLS